MLSRRKDTTATIAIEQRIHLVRNQRIVLAKDLADLYGVTTHRLNEQVARNRERVPPDFMFQLPIQEVSALRSQSAILESKGRGQHPKYLPYAFTEHGTVMAATVLNSQVAVKSSILVVRAFIRLREMLMEHSDLKRRLQDIEIRLAKGFATHEQELQEIRFLLAQLEQPVDSKKGKIGF